MADYDPTKGNRRALDMHIGDNFKRIEEKLKELKDKTDAVYDEVYGGPGGKVGIAEKVRNIMLLWGVVLFLLNYGPKAWDFFFGAKPLFGDAIVEKWKKESTERVRIYNKEKKRWDYYYMIGESKEQPAP